MKDYIRQIKDLQTETLQAFFKIEAANFPKICYQVHYETWKQAFERIASNEPKMSVSYIKYINDKESFSIDNLDTTAICSMYGKDHLWLQEKIYDALKMLRQDRNFESHMNSNESEDELNGFANAALYNLMNFIESVKPYYKANNRNDSEKVSAMIDQFTSEYLRRTKELMKGLRNRYQKIVFDKLYYEHIAEIIQNDKERADIVFWAFWKAIDSQKDAHALFLFYKALSEKGYENELIITTLAEVYYGYWDTIKDRIDYTKAAYYFSKLRDIKTAHNQKMKDQHKLALANILINNLSAENKKEQGKVLISEFDPQNLENTVDASGKYTFYKIKERPIALINGQLHQFESMEELQTFAKRES